MTCLRHDSGQSPPPPEELEPDQQLEWKAITARLPVDWFTGENLPMLKELCRHITYARELARQIVKVRAEIQAFMEGSAADTAGSIGVAEHRKIEQNCAMSCAGCCAATDTRPSASATSSTKLRLTKQSRYDASSITAPPRMPAQR